MTLGHAACQQDELDKVLNEWAAAGFRLTHVVSPDYREGVKEWHLFFERPKVSIWPTTFQVPPS